MSELTDPKDHIHIPWVMDVGLVLSLSVTGGSPHKIGGMAYRAKWNTGLFQPFAYHTVVQPLCSVLHMESKGHKCQSLAVQNLFHLLLLLLLQIPDDNHSRGCKTFNIILLNGSRDSNQF